jgi:hypothetical protein
MSSAGDGLQASAVARLSEGAGLAVYDAPPVQAAFPYAVVEAGAESDWGHKSGAGREVRLTVTLRDGGERPVRLRALTAAAESALQAPLTVDTWQVVTFAWLRSRSVRDGRPPGPVEWTGLIEYRARMLALPDE